MPVPKPIQLTPEEYEQLAALTTQNAELDQQMKLQMAQANAMRQGTMPQMRQAGRIATAPHWLEMLGGLAREKTAGDLQRAALSNATKMSQNTARQNRDWAGKMYGWGQPSAPMQEAGGTGTLNPQATPQGMLTLPSAFKFNPDGSY
jgi:hypothetical protein